MIGALDELLVDLAYCWFRLTGRAKGKRVAERELASEPLRGLCAVFIPAWREDRVIGDTIRQALDIWRDEKLRLYVGCYRCNKATISVTMNAAAGDSRLRIVVHDLQGPTCKADCLNRLYRALWLDEQRYGRRVRMVVLQDAEDMVDPAALHLLDRGMEEAEFIQLPVLALPHPESPWISGHYSDEFAESHGKTMVVRQAMGAAIPGAGVGCAIDRVMIERLDRVRGGDGPFAAGALTEDYELGQLVPALGGETRCLRARTEQGRVIARRASFPAQLSAAVRQMTRWVHGIALQGWDRLGWSGGIADLWKQLRDRPWTVRRAFAGRCLCVDRRQFGAVAIGITWNCYSDDNFSCSRDPALGELRLAFMARGVARRVHRA
ncbi:glycosyltransferase [Qipengyuania algicida]|uniref:glycosyltransferase n=1 Tax=Qipengyuania algicida TaxID=1836209 RepID=UPI001F2ED81A|nr:glycosyltransferase [Qipengyuania algicida]